MLLPEPVLVVIAYLQSVSLYRLAMAPTFRQDEGRHASVLGVRRVSFLVRFTISAPESRSNFSGSYYGRNPFVSGSCLPAKLASHAVQIWQRDPHP
ncbi:hypothetical protein Q31a_22810 [Aureliella helgolandensis]|uniref:Uncharacterized protein n=1 Tax=Aureliella helgolandensis TaxID=2527968 RepID=A0A518G5V8_9BACT|nr:hypothetical protein Q31a_22810 [Aureliella helgolandensis]